MMQGRYLIAIGRAALPVMSAALLISAFPGFNIWAAAYFALVPLLFAIEKRRPAGAFLVSYLTGLMFFIGAVHWLIHVTLPGMMIVAAYLALYFGLFGLFVSLALRFVYSPVSTKRASGVSSALLGLSKSPELLPRYYAAAGNFALIFFIPAVWASSEWLRSNTLTGFPWALLGHSQAFGALPVIQIADVTGAYGVGAFIVLINACIYLLIRGIRSRKGFPHAPVIAAVIASIIVLRYGYLRMNNLFEGEPLKVCVVQGNIPQEKKWDGEFADSIMARYSALTKDAASGKPDLIIWPETAVPGFMESDEELLSEVRGLSASVATPLLVGTPRYERSSGRCYNSATLFSADGRIIDTYDKVHLVPFGEYIPFREQLSFVDKFAHNPIGDFTPGEGVNVFNFLFNRVGKTPEGTWRVMKKASFSCLICFEDIFPELARRAVSDGAAFLVNITNDAWFMRSAAPYQHAQASIFRSVENRTWMVRAANTGLSCFIDRAGRIAGRVEASGRDIFVSGFAVLEILPARALTFYNRHGDVFARACIAFSAICLAMLAAAAKAVGLKKEG